MKQALLVVVLLMSNAWASQAQDIAGDWEGTLRPGTAELRLLLHVVAQDDGTLKATLDSLDQGARGIPVSSIAVKDGAVTLGVDAVRGSYDGKFSSDGKSIDGTWSQGGGTLPLVWRRPSGEAPPAPKPAAPSDIDGDWQGTLNAGGTSLRLVVHIVNTEAGLTATMDSLDQGAMGIPVTTVTRDGSSLALDIRGIGGRFEGRIGGDQSTIVGTWSQGGNSLPLTLSRAAK
jgi:hypothetical protein